MCTLHPFTAQYMRAPCHERCITKMMSKQLTSLNILGLYLHLGSAEGYYNEKDVGGFFLIKLDIIPLVP
jgi:hypothetical protein